ncbi:adenosylcobinamide kinase /adenosylcobinamide-phosphate guanylyltransferase [Clostridium acidisoli DSM 12555]|jgi:adenosylcobinamide kinase/adenosylcobinamide-phosphate guanylyltransferase|uniref:Adenosylcobinamide kinase n=1 Tax=Clostridium acidisoli DSM 12555 TaxID=1121291 RepID=A0A1W1XFK2_9CLOT|nr:bifunctional adenosylcobinamide kinase/adenosylcobinamide-phosphate guanylyltransferase [Clostridium acidisoli]SMC22743.1 adenosylcobinamide kinase /adenosylcobinamide-phosphate guanylyltransferase [Clostridium acidisoli DSM 12555]
MSNVILVTGGARSGKSSFAESLYKDSSDVVYIATSKIYDDEMKERVELHKSSRPREWKTFEGNYELYKAVTNSKKYILDCLTIMTSNIMFDITRGVDRIKRDKQKQVEDKVVAEIESLIKSIKEVDGTLVIVTNEVGCSIVPENHIARVYRDIVGKINQRVAAISSDVYLVTCGIPLKVK